MSKLTTDELIDALEVIVTEANSGERFKFRKENRKAVTAIIAKLRAADALCDAAEKRLLYKSPSPDQVNADLRKALRAYEEAGS